MRAPSTIPNILPIKYAYSLRVRYLFFDSSPARARVPTAIPAIRVAAGAMRLNISSWKKPSGVLKSPPPNAAKMVVGQEGVVKQRHPSLGGEDFAYFLQKVPGCLVRFGAGHPELPNIPAHSPYFDFDEGVLPIGASFLAQVAWQTLQQKNFFSDETKKYVDTERQSDTKRKGKKK